MSLCWLVVGIVLILLEFVIPGVVICFFGVSAIIASAIVFIFSGIALTYQLLIFAIGGAVLALLCRRYFKGGIKSGSGGGDIDEDDVCGALCVCKEKITPVFPGKVEFRGSLWSASADEDISEGDVCLISSRENLTLHVRKKAE
jgi:membrane protein implicated in regulation of membrane protease activity